MQDNKKFKLVSVLLSGPFDKVFSYKINISSYEVGKIIIAPFRNQKLLGIILDEGAIDYSNRLPSNYFENNLDKSFSFIFLLTNVFVTKRIMVLQMLFH